MKKNVLLLVIGILVMLPFGVKAYSIDITNDESSKSKCVKVADECTNGKCVSRCEIYIKDNTTPLTSAITIILKPDYDTLVISDITAADGFTYSGDTATAVFTPTDPLGVTATSFKLASYTVTYPEGTDCSMSIGLSTEEVVPVPTPDPVPNPPHTGVSLPVVVLIGALGISVITYAMTNKNKKMYKI